MRSLITAVRKKKGQATIETIMMLPFIIAILFFIYQSYTLINKVQVVQKYMKGAVVGALMNRNVITAENPSIATGSPTIPPDGKYFMVYGDGSNVPGPPTAKFMKVNLDDITINMLLYFCPASTKGAIKTYLQGQRSSQTLGVCIGGTSMMGDQVSTKVLGDSMTVGETCNDK